MNFTQYCRLNRIDFLDYGKKFLKDIINFLHKINCDIKYASFSNFFQEKKVFYHLKLFFATNLIDSWYLITKADYIDKYDTQIFIWLFELNMGIHRIHYLFSRFIWQVIWLILLRWFVVKSYRMYWDLYCNDLLYYVNNYNREGK